MESVGARDPSGRACQSSERSAWCAYARGSRIRLARGDRRRRLTGKNQRANFVPRQRELVLARERARSGVVKVVSPANRDQQQATANAGSAHEDRTGHAHHGHHRKASGAGTPASTGTARRPRLRFALRAHIAQPPTCRLDCSSPAVCRLDLDEDRCAHQGKTVGGRITIARLRSENHRLDVTVNQSQQRTRKPVAFSQPARTSGIGPSPKRRMTHLA